MTRLTDSAPAASSVRGIASSGQRGAEQPATIPIHCQRCGGREVVARRFGNGYLCQCGTYLGWLVW